MSADLVPHRECGPCSVCCKVPIIDAPELKKKPGILCPNCVAGAGCQIYEIRPHVCRVHFCGWRHLALLDESWRPDISNVYIELKSLPSEEYCGFVPALPSGLRITILGELSPKHTELLAANIASLVAGDIPVVLTVAGSPEHMRGALLLNPILKPYPSNDAVFAEALAVVFRACHDMPAQQYAFA